VQPRNLKSTRNVLLSLILTTLVLSGCSIFPGGRDVETVEAQTIEIPREPLALDLPEPVDLDTIEWIAITPDNADKVFSELESSGTNTVLIGLTPNGYEKLSLNIAKIRGYINTQRVILVKYQDYYEGSDPSPSQSPQQQQ
jgi:hypothetical protein